MENEHLDRRKFIKAIAGSAAISALPQSAFSLNGSSTVNHEKIESQAEATVKSPARIKFAVIGINHGHIYGQVGAVLHGGGELVSFYAKEPDLAGAFTKRFPQA